jgi:hypothetical protein
MVVDADEFDRIRGQRAGDLLIDALQSLTYPDTAPGSACMQIFVVAGKLCAAGCWTPMSFPSGACQDAMYQWHTLVDKGKKVGNTLSQPRRFDEATALMYPPHRSL